MKRCLNGIEYEECDRQAMANSDHCEECDAIETEKAQEAFLDSYYGGSAATTLKERQDATFEELKRLGIR